METITVTDSRIYSIIVLYDMHTTFFNNALDGISDTDAHSRLDTKANHVAWLTGSLVQQRFELANKLGIDENQTAIDLFKENKGIQEGVTYPSLTDFKKDWELISPILKEALENVSAEKLDEKFEMMPGMVMSNFDLISFITYREANCIGQIALWRRLLGYDAMKYM
jgi:hypothetical protein